MSKTKTKTKTKPVDAEPVEMKYEVEPAAHSELAERALVQQQAELAHKFPRNLTTSLRKLETLACKDKATAESMWYTLSRGGKHITGPSIRMAEFAARCWGNMGVKSQIVEIGRTMVTAQAVAWDMEANYWGSIETKRRITDRHGNRFNEDMIVVTCNAAGSVAYREAVFKIVTKSELAGVMKKCRNLVYNPEGRSMDQMRNDAIEWWVKRGAEPDMVFNYLGVRSRKDIELDHLIALGGRKSTMEENGWTAEAALKIQDVQQSKRSSLTDELGSTSEPAKGDNAPTEDVSDEIPF